MTELTRITLTKKVSAYGDEVTELVLREPGVADTRALKSLPYSIGEDGMPRPLPDVCGRYIARLAEVPESAVDQMDVSDFHRLVWVVVGFFINRGLGQETPSQV